MTILNRSGRRFEVFDPNNKEHRRIFHDVLKLNSWSKSPIRFWIDGNQTDVMSYCTQKMTQWYADKEFGKQSSKKS